MTMCFWLRTMLTMLNTQHLSFGMVTKLMVLRAHEEVLRI